MRQHARHGLLIAGIATLVREVALADRWLIHGARSLDNGGVTFVLAWVFAGFTVLVSVMSLVNHRLQRMAGTIAFVSAWMMIAAGFTTDPRWVDIMAIAPWFCAAMMSIAAATVRDESPCTRVPTTTRRSAT